MSSGADAGTVTDSCRDGAAQDGMGRLHRATEVVSVLSLSLAAAVLVAMLLHVLTEIVLRAVFSTSTFVLEEFLGYGVAAVTCLSMGYASSRGSLIRVNFVLTRLSLKCRRIVEAVSCLVAVSLVGFLAYFVYLRVARNLARGTVSSTIAQVPAWIPEAIVLAGLIVLCLQLGMRALLMVAAGEEVASRVLAHEQDGAE